MDVLKIDGGSNMHRTEHDKILKNNKYKVIFCFFLFVWFHRDLLK